MNRKWLIGAGILLVVALLVWANLRKLEDQPAAGDAPSGPEGAPLVKVVEVQPRDLIQTVVAPGTLEATAVRELRAPFSTDEVLLQVGVGDRVTAGQVVAELNADSIRLQVANQEAAVARAESALNQLYRQRELAPLQVAQRLEQARVQFLQAQQGLDGVLQQASAARQRLQQARANLLALQNRAAASTDQVEAAREALVEAEAAYLTDPLNPQVSAAFEEAQAAYDDALKRSAETARQTAAELAQAEEALRAAEEEMAQYEGENPPAIALARAQVESARTALEIARVEAEQGEVSAEQIRAAELDLAAAREALRQAQEQLEGVHVTAPAEGTVLAVLVEDGRPVQQGQPILLLGSLDPLKVTARVDEVDIVKVAVGQPLTIRSNAYLQERFPGEVTRVAPQATEQPGSAPYFAVEGRVENPDGKLRAGMSAEARIETASRRDVLVVGLESIREEEDQVYVLVVKDFQVELRPVRLGLRTQTEVEIVEGLQPGEQVIVSPFTLIRTLEDGARVRVEVTEPRGRGDG